MMVAMSFPATTAVTAIIMRDSPLVSRMVTVSPKTVMPKKMAVTGSREPRIAVGVEPMYCMALLVQKKDMAVGKMARASRLPHMYQWVGS